MANSSYQVTVSVFEPIARHVVAATAAFRLVEPLPEESFSVPLTQSHTIDELDALLLRSIERYEGIARGLVEIARGRFHMHAFGKQAGARMARDLRDRLGTDRVLAVHLDGLDREVEVWPEEGGPYAGRFHADEASLAAVPEWRRRPVHRLPTGPAMLGDEERQLLFWLTSSQFEGRGAVVDLGAFLGASAAHLAAGLEARENTSSERVLSYDLFVWGDATRRHLPDRVLDDGADTVPLVRELLGPLGDRVELRKGDICARGWQDGPIEVLFVDFTRSWAHHDAVCDAFVRHLVPGGWLVHQDYVYVLCYWLHMWIERWADHFEPIARHVAPATAVFRLREPLPEDALSVPLTDSHTVDELDGLLRRSIDRYEGAERGLIEIARARFVMHARGRDAAARETTALRTRYGGSDGLRGHLNALEHELRHWPEDGGPYAGRFRTG